MYITLNMKWQWSQMKMAYKMTLPKDYFSNVPTKNCGPWGDSKTISRELLIW